MTDTDVNRRIAELAADRVREVEAGYARGWSFTPLNGKVPYTVAWQTAPRETLEQAIEWARAGNVGMRCGEVSGVYVIDTDPGAPDLDLPTCPTVITGRGGRHYYFATNGVSLGNSASNLAPHVDTRGDGGQSVFVGSIHPNTGDPYYWAEGRSPDEVPMPPIPAWVIEKLTTATPPPAKPAKSAGPDAPARALKAMLSMNMVDKNDGSKRLYACACRCVEHDLADGEAIAAVRAYETVKPFPVAWTDAQICDRLRDAESEVSRGSANTPKHSRKAIDGTAATAPDRPEIVLSTDEHLVVAEAIDALAEDPCIFQRGRQLVRIVHTQAPGPDDVIWCPEGTLTIVPVTPTDARLTLTSKRRVMRYDKRSDVNVSAHPPQWLITALTDCGSWPKIPTLTGLSDCPVLRPDGTIHQTPGHDPLTGVIFDPSGVSFPDVGDVNQADAVTAAGRLFEVVADFPMAGDAHKSAWLAGLLTPIGRYAYSGPSPLFLFDANIRGAGKSLLAQAVATIVTGRPIPVTGYADSVELSKRITAIAIAGIRFVLLDNVVGFFGNDALDRALTSTRWQDRILGKSESVDLPLLATWYATSNNAQVKADTCRRIIPCRLTVMTEHPEDREGFRHTDLVGWITANRPRLLMDALTILKAYIRAGKPDMRIRPMGSFEGWSSLIRAAVVWCEFADPLETALEIRATSDTVANDLQDLLAAWETVFPGRRGVTSIEIHRTCFPVSGPPTDEATQILRSALEAILDLPAGKHPTARLIGNRLRYFRQRVAGGRYLDTAANKTQAGAAWVVKVCDCGDSGDS